jgi:hypothetical protein
MVLRDTGGFHVQTNGKQFVPAGDARAAATWKAAVEELLSSGDLEPRGSKGVTFAVTAKGYKLAEALKQE